MHVDQFQKKTRANKLALHRKLYSLRLKDGDSVQHHVKSITEIFNELSVIGAKMDEGEKVYSASNCQSTKHL